MGMGILACGPMDSNAGEAVQLRAELAECQAALAEHGSKSAASAVSAPPEADVAPAASPCTSIELDPAHQASFSILRSSRSGKKCSLVIEAKQPIVYLAFNWVQYDTEGIKLGDRVEIVKDLGTGDKAKLDIRLEGGATRIVSQTR
jgi:hypothetical protein